MNPVEIVTATEVREDIQDRSGQWAGPLTVDLLARSAGEPATTNEPESARNEGGCERQATDRRSHAGGHEHRLLLLRHLRKVLVVLHLDPLLVVDAGNGGLHGLFHDLVRNFRQLAGQAEEAIVLG